MNAFRFHPCVDQSKGVLLQAYIGCDPRKARGASISPCQSDGIGMLISFPAPPQLRWTQHIRKAAFAEC
ncbi:hypothetical protein CEXT_223211 [Caerostris extrusa]|uniref:Uncharacterized protein n=1 Tax=Caerostris extrusa TaxID=172846 RepID=A0AAV4THC2_CAEEX|nr:hypothetical protein CEXT_223211 [Caerostris extrusa]